MASDSEDDYVEFGTALEPLDEDEIPRKKPLNLEEQVVTDENGRRRFHGAFTGGFSAGFYNTVGSLEGWKPSAFKSTRAVKGVISAQKPQDFMDDEDIGEFGIAPTFLQARQDYANSNKRKRVNFSDGPIPGMPVLGELLQPVRETVGIKLLRQMGWKPGQGIGPRVTKHEKHQFSDRMKRVYGCMLPPGNEESHQGSDSDSDIDWDNITFAPDDYEPFLCKPKENSFGIGYVGLDRRPILGSSGPSEIKFQEKNRKVHIRGQAFGVGAFEEEDEDIYSKDDMTQYNFELVEREKSSKKAGSSGSSRWSEGVLEGFVVASVKVVKKYFPPPLLPKSFKGQHKVRVSRFEPVAPAPSEERRKDLGRHEMKADVRGVLLGESMDESEAAAQREAKKITENLVSDVPLNDNRFKPFVLNPDKQSRYEKYLKLIKIGKRECLKDLQPITMTEWDKVRETVEFEQASRLFQPLAGVMSDRFTSASQPDDGSNPLAVVEKTKHGNEVQINAAKMKMYGQLTRETSEWRPCSLLCKRFNIPEPHTNLTPLPKKKPTNFSIFDCLAAAPIKNLAAPEIKVEEVEEPATEQQQQEPEAEVEVEAEAETETETQPQPVIQTTVLAPTYFPDPQEKIDLFKAIFLDSDDDEEQEKEDERKEEENRNEIRLLVDERYSNTKRNTSPPRGIFENIDLERLTFRRKEPQNADKLDQPDNPEQPAEKPAEKPVEKPAEVVEDVVEGAYGPKLPEKIVANIPCSVEYSVGRSSRDLWVEKDVAERKHKKKDKKHKKDKHKSKHKHKKHKR